MAADMNTAPQPDSTTSGIHDYEDKQVYVAIIESQHWHLGDLNNPKLVLGIKPIKKVRNKFRLDRGTDDLPTHAQRAHDVWLQFTSDRAKHSFIDLRQPPFDYSGSQPTLDIPDTQTPGKPWYVGQEVYVEASFSKKVPSDPRLFWNIHRLRSRNPEDDQKALNDFASTNADFFSEITSDLDSEKGSSPF